MFKFIEMHDYVMATLWLMLYQLEIELDIPEQEYQEKGSYRV
jgi:hypothetical protein